MAEISDSEREAVVRDLTRHCGDGRLTLDELEQRVGEAYAATTRTELRHALRELPRLRDERVPAERRRPAFACAGGPSPARRCGSRVVGGPAAVLLTLITVLFVTAHYVLAIALLALWLPRYVQRGYVRA